MGRFGGGGPGPPVAESAEVYRPDGEGPAATTGTHTNVKSSLLNTNVKSKINRTKSEMSSLLIEKNEKDY